jgi:outer membrane protein
MTREAQPPRRSADTFTENLMRGLSAVTLLLAVTCAPAQQAGDTVVLVGWMHVTATHEEQSLHTDLRPSLVGSALGIADSFDSPDTTASVHAVDAVGISFARFLTDHWSLALNVGIPPIVAVSGSGVVQPTGPAGSLFAVDLGDPALNPLGKVRQWSPALAVQYHLFNPHARIRPFLGAGFTVTWFTDEHLKPAFEDELNNRIGRQLALATGKPGPTSISVNTSSTWAPVFVAGVPVALNEHWGLTLSAGYIPISTTTQLRIYAEDGTQLAISRPRIRAGVLVTGLLLSYRF